jgi:hypothetical protein
MFRKLSLLAVTAHLPVACSSFGGEVSGVFYYVQLQQSQQSSVCMELASDLSASFPLRVVDQVLPTRPSGQCIVDLDNKGQAPRILTTIVWDPGNRRFSLRVWGSGQEGISTARELAPQFIAIARKRFPDAVITNYKPTFSLLGP